MEIVAGFEICYSRFLDPDGRAVRELPGFANDPEELIALYRAMVLTRAFDAKAIALQRTGRLGTYGSSLGQEAVAVGVGAAMAPEDVLVPAFREQGAQILRGVTLVELLLYWGGDERGSDFAGPRQDFPVCVPVGAHAPHAAGVALAMQLRGEARAAVCVFGDGATSKGDVYEAMNFAGLRKLPLIFVVNNNGWAISVPRARQSAAETLAQKSIAAGFAGEQVDGNDVIAVREAVERALAQARSGGGPSLIEAITYRLKRPHHRRRRQPLPRRRRGQRALEGRAGRASCATTLSRPATGTRTTRRRCWRDCAAQVEAAAEELSRHPTAAAQRYVRPPLRQIAAGAGRTARRTPGRKGGQRHDRTRPWSKPCSLALARAMRGGRERCWCWARTWAWTAACSAPPRGS